MGGQGRWRLVELMSIAWVGAGERQLAQLLFVSIPFLISLVHTGCAREH